MNSQLSGDELITLNGINGQTGRYFTQSLTAHELVHKVITRRSLPKPANSNLVYRLAPEYGDGSEIASSGWGIIFPANADKHVVDGIEQALSPLIYHRRSQTQYFRMFKGSDGYRCVDGTGETFYDFAKRHNAGIGPVMPNRLPYYLLLVGDPNSIPFSFQFALDTQYAVGRVCFGCLEDYHHYAISVVRAETGGLRLPRNAVFFGTQHEGDLATRLSARRLISPLAEYVTRISEQRHLGWQSQLVPPEEATKGKLKELLGGAETPAILFTATHGLAWDYGHERQLTSQGALICQEYPGPRNWHGELDPQFYFTGEDLVGNLNNGLHGMIAILFACFGGGTPYQDDFAIAYGRERSALAEHAFVADLPRRMLSCRAGGALAVIAHVERVWTYSFQWGDGGQQHEAMSSLLFQLMCGLPVGKAMECFNERYTAIAGDWLPKIEDLLYEPDKYDVYEVATNWIMAKDARGYMVIGDPAVRVPRTDSVSETTERTTD